MAAGTTADFQQIDSVINTMKNWLEGEYPSLVNKLKQCMDDQIAASGEGKAWIGQKAQEFITKMDENVNQNFNVYFKQRLDEISNNLVNQLNIWKSVYQ